MTIEWLIYGMEECLMIDELIFGIVILDLCLEENHGIEFEKESVTQGYYFGRFRRGKNIVNESIC